MIKFLTDLLEKPLKIGTVLQSRYKIETFVGKGSYGIVYLAFDQSTTKLVIIKEHRNRKGKNSKEMLKSEAKILSLLNHPSVPKCLNFFHQEQKSFLVMDFIEGKNFEDLVLNEGRIFNEKESLQILLKVANIVKYLHENQIIHRDLRLPNIIERDNQIFIIDFGLAVSCHTDQDHSKFHVDEKNFFREKSFRGDFYALGHFLLFLLYSNFEATSKKDQSWEEELLVSDNTKKMIRKLLRLENSYDHINDLSNDLNRLLETLETH